MKKLVCPQCGQTSINVTTTAVLLNRTTASVGCHDYLTLPPENFFCAHCGNKNFMPVEKEELFDQIENTIHSLQECLDDIQANAGKFIKAYLNSQSCKMIVMDYEKYGVDPIKITVCNDNSGESQTIDVITVTLEGESIYVSEDGTEFEVFSPDYYWIMECIKIYEQNK